MDRAAFEDMAAIEDRHWWFVGRRRILRTMLKSLNLPKDLQILEAGCGSGGNLPLLAEFGNVSAIEYDAPAREHAASRNVAIVEAGHLPDTIPFSEKSFDLIAVLDVLEHLDEDGASLNALTSRLKPGGHMLITVPAYAFLWSAHDTLHHHKRRYRIGQMIRLVRDSGCEVTFASYFNFFLFPLIALVRVLEKGKSAAHVSQAMGVPPGIINRFLTEFFASERFLLPYISLPFGVSILLVAQKPTV